MHIAQDMRFGFEVREGKLNLYQRIQLLDISGQDGCREVLHLAGQVPHRGRLELALQRAFEHIEFEPEPDQFLAHDLLTGEQYTGMYNPKRNAVTNLTKSTRIYAF